jgi:hypothetical protein
VKSGGRSAGRIRDATRDGWAVAAPRRPPTRATALARGGEHGEGLTWFVEPAAVAMDNNAAERVERGPVVGRKNSYGSGALGSGPRAALRFAVEGVAEVASGGPASALVAGSGADDVGGGGRHRRCEGLRLPAREPIGRTSSGGVVGRGPQSPRPVGRRSGPTRSNRGESGGGKNQRGQGCVRDDLEQYEHVMGLPNAYQQTAHVG